MTIFALRIETDTADSVEIKPEKEMKFKIDENFVRVAKWCSRYSVEDLSVQLCVAMEKAGIISDKPENIGKTLYEAKEIVQVLEILNVLGHFSSWFEQSFDKLIKNDPQIWDAVNNLVLIDWCACPYCGEMELEWRDPEYHEYSRGDWWTPPCYVIDFYVYECPECGEIIKLTKEL